MLLFDSLLSQTLLHHCFLFFSKHIFVVVGRQQEYFLEYTTTSLRRDLSINFPEDKDLVTMRIFHCGRDRDVPSVKTNVLFCSQVLSAVSLVAGTNCYWLGV